MDDKNLVETDVKKAEGLMSEAEEVSEKAEESEVRTEEVFGKEKESEAKTEEVSEEEEESEVKTEEVSGKEKESEVKTEEVYEKAEAETEKISEKVDVDNLDKLEKAAESAEKRWFLEAFFKREEKIRKARLTMFIIVVFILAAGLIIAVYNGVADRARVINQGEDINEAKSDAEDKYIGEDVVIDKNGEVYQIPEYAIDWPQEPKKPIVVPKVTKNNAVYIPAPEKLSFEKAAEILYEKAAAGDERYVEICRVLENIPQEIIVDLANNGEMLGYTLGYAYRLQNMAVLPESDRITEAELKEDFPLFTQWDERWGYELYGGVNTIAVSGCGPTSLAMAVVALKHEDVTPKDVADFLADNGYYVTGDGTLWSAIVAGAEQFGLNAYETYNRESEIKKCIDNGGVSIICVKAGDFTAGGHFIMIYGYDEEGFYVNDPFCVYRSTVKWTYEQIKDQIIGVWAVTEQVDD